MKKRIGILLTAALLIAVFTGCGKGSTGERENAAADTFTVTVEPKLIPYISFTDAAVAMVLPDGMEDVTSDGAYYIGSTDTVTVELTRLDRICDMNIDALKTLAEDITGTEGEIVNLNGAEVVQIDTEDSVNYFILSPDGDDYRLRLNGDSEEIAAIGETICASDNIPLDSSVTDRPIAAHEIDYTVLVNSENPLPDGWEDTIDVVYTDNSEGNRSRIERETFKAYMGLRDKLIEENGIYIEIDTALRTVAEQEELIEYLRNEYGDDYVAEYVAVPGYSEHHTGLAMDIYFDRDKTEGYESDEDIWAQIHSRLADYGFILRYPVGGEDITGFSYEPWHIRYVGAEAAAEIAELGITMEEWAGR